MIKALGGLLSLIILSFWVLVIYMICNLDMSGGIKPLIETLWCGSAGCFSKY